MRKIKNPYASIDGYDCFGCSPTNPLGLKMEFYDTGEEIISDWDPSIHYQGYFDVLHGGIQATLMDEIAGWVVLTKTNTGGVTSSMDIKYKKPVFVSKGKVKLVGKLIESNKRFATISTVLMSGDGEVCSEGEVTYFLYPPEMARKKLHYPGPEAFYEE